MKMGGGLALIVLLAVAAAGYEMIAATVTVTGSWSLGINATDLIAGGGSELIPSYTSTGTSIVCNIGGINKAWRLNVHRQDVSWHASLTISVRRTGGTGGSLSGGTVFQTVGTTAASFFTGEGPATDIPFEYQLTGVSTSLPADTYSTTIYITLVLL